jgi:hypothetical protein
MSKNRKNDRVEQARDFIESVIKGDNVGAKEKLERILKEKTARRIKDTLAS